MPKKIIFERDALTVAWGGFWFSLWAFIKVWFKRREDNRRLCQLVDEFSFDANETLTSALIGGAPHALIPPPIRWWDRLLAKISY